MKRITGLIFFILILSAGCGNLRLSEGQKTARETSSPSPVDVFTAAVWNVQTLYDGRDTGNEYAEFRETEGWSAEKYQARLTAISQAIQQMAGPAKAAPCIIGFVEIENIGILEDLAGGSLSKNGYYWTAFANLPGSSLGIGFLSRFPITDTRAHSITIGNDTAPRPVLEIRVEPRGEPLVFLLCHWKSKLGDDNATEALRRSSARVVQRRLRELKETETPVIVMGDLNENHDEFYRRSGAILSALLPDDPDAAALAFNKPDEYLVLSGEKPPRARSFTKDVPALYTPWDTELKDGSYYFRGEWETIDHILLSDLLFNGTGWEYADCRVLNHAPFISSKGSPDSYVPRFGRGLSDHLPLLLYLRFLE